MESQWVHGRLASVYALSLPVFSLRFVSYIQVASRRSMGFRMEETGSGWGYYRRFVASFASPVLYTCEPTKEVHACTPLTPSFSSETVAFAFIADLRRVVLDFRLLVRSRHRPLPLFSDTNRARHETMVKWIERRTLPSERGRENREQRIENER